MIARFDPLNKKYKSTRGGARRAEKIVFTVEADAEEVIFRIRPDYGEYRAFCAKKAGNRFSVSFCPNETGLFFYNFLIDGVSYGMPYNGYADEEFGRLFENGEEFRLTVYSEDFSTPAWLKGGVIYQIFPDRFYRSGKTPHAHGVHREWGEMPEYRPINGKILNDDFFGGDLKGITEKLPYLNSLGVTAIYLNPIFEARSNHRYDTGDYMKIDLNLGTEEDLKELFASAAKFGMRVILDGVFNHTGDDSIYFNKQGRYPSVGAFQSKSSPYFGWYNFESFPTRYRCWWGIEILPEINENSPSYREFICGDGGVIKKYLRLGAGGWRLDVADELPGSFIRKIRAAIKEEDPEAVVVGEVWENVTDKISYGVRREYFQGKELDSAMNYPLKSAIIDCLLAKDTAQLAAVLRQQNDLYPAPALNSLMNLIGTHDVPRIINVLSGASYPIGREEQAHSVLNKAQYAEGEKLAALAAILEFTLYGVPSVYYGDERGMTGWSDPFNRGCMEWDRQSPLLGLYEKLGQIRKSAVFVDSQTDIEYLTKRAIVYSRSGEKEKVYVALNVGMRTLELQFTGECRDLLNDTASRKFELAPCSALIIEEKL